MDWNTLIEWEPGRLWYMDMPYKRYGMLHVHRMVVIRLQDSSLIIHNPVELTTHLQTELTSLGRVCAVVSPSITYHQALSEWWLTYPQALFYATPSLIALRSDLNFDDGLSNQSPSLWKGKLLQTPILGSSKPRKFVFCDPQSHTLILADNLQAAQSHLPTGQKLLALIQGHNQDLSYPYTDRRHINQMSRLRFSVQEIMTWPFDRLLSSNGLIIEQKAKEALFQAFWWAF
jgi:hypothetical protein